MKHLVVSISGHGFGHVAQTAPVLNNLYQRFPGLRITVRSSVSPDHLRSRVHVPFSHLPSEGDIGMVMSSALDVEVESSCDAYSKFHSNWEKRVGAEASLLQELGADIVLSNIGYLPLAGAQRAGLPNMAFCSLNWADIYRHYCGENEIVGQIHACYSNADVFFCTTPGMAMADLSNRVQIAPIAEMGANRREEINRGLRLTGHERLVLVSMGGIAGRFPIEDWPRIRGVRWLVQQSWQVNHPDAIEMEELHMDFPDILASCDALLCKPGYGSFVEAACCGIPVLYVDRPDWPESPALIEWLHQYDSCRMVTRSLLENGNLEHELESLWNAPSHALAEPCGAEQVAEWIAGRLDL